MLFWNLLKNGLLVVKLEKFPIWQKIPCVFALCKVICAEDWSQGVADAGNQITQYEFWELPHVPIYNDRIYVFIDGVPNYDWYYESTENRVYFNTMPEEKSLVEIAYYYQ